MRAIRVAVNTHFCVCPGPRKTPFVSLSELEVEARQKTQRPGNNTLDIREIRMEGVGDFLKKNESVWKARQTHESNVGLDLPSCQCQRQWGGVASLIPGPLCETF